jgi:hypothetical protein
MKFESPFHDWPRVTAINDKNGTGVHITGTFLGVAPSYYILAWYIVLCTMGVMAVLPLALISRVNGWVFIAITASLYPAYFLIWRPLMGVFFGSLVDMRIYRDVIILRDSRSAPYRNYDRTQPIEIRIEPSQKGFGTEGPRRLLEKHKQSVEIVMIYGLRRVVLGEFQRKDMEVAQSLMLRIQEAVIKTTLAGAMGKQLESTGVDRNDIDIR